MPLTREQRKQLLADILPLNALRVAAAASLVVVRVWLWLPYWTPAHPPPDILNRLALMGFSAVGMFFILSGFTLSCVYLAALEGPFPVRQFFVARFARMYPVYVLGVLLYAPRAWVELVHRWPGNTLPHAAISLAGTLLLIQAWSPKNFVYWNPPAWFLSAQAFFFVLFAYFSTRLWKLRRNAAIALALLLMLMPAVMAYLTKNAGNGEHHLYMKPPAQLHQFVLGILLARLYISDRGQPARLRWFARSNVPLLLLVLCGAATALALLTMPYERFRLLMQFGGLLPLNAALILCLCLAGPALRRALTRPWLLRAGEVSFSIYVLHYPLAWLMRLEHYRSTLLILAYFAVCVVAGLLAWRFVEKPARDRILTWTHARSRESQAAASLS